jgi:phosphocarrier protein
MQSETITIVNKLGLHARAAAKLVNTASRFRSDVRLRRDNKDANAKSIMGVMMLAAGKGTEMTLEVEGPDEEEALQAMKQLIAERFGEGE